MMIHLLKRTSLGVCTSQRLAACARRRLTLSSVVGALEPPLDHRSLPEYFESCLLPSFGERPALVCRTERERPFGGPSQVHESSYLRWTFGELDEHVAALARGLSQMGVQKGDRIGVIMGNNSAYATLQWACVRIGAILVTINPAYRAHELLAALNLVGVSTLVVVPHIRTSSYLDMLASVAPALSRSRPGTDLDIPELATLRRILVFDDGSTNSKSNLIDKFTNLREVFQWERSAREERVVMDKEDVINLQFTSGTTGAPKAVALTHHGLLNNGLSIGRCMRLGPTDVLCNVPPLFHCFGNLAAWVHGSCILYASPVYSPPHIVDALVSPSLPDETCTALHGVPTHFIGVLQELEKRGQTVDGGRLRTGIASGSPVPMELMKKLREKMGLEELTIAYGMTETSPVSFQIVPTDPLIKRVETVGRVHPHVRAKIVDEAGNIVPVNTPGELCVAGYLLQKGYWNDEEQTKKAIKTDKEGTLWMHTGDEAIMDAEGYLQIVGRIKDLIIRGGENLFPVQIENVLLRHPDIVEAAAISVPDAKYGEVVGAWIVLRDGATLTREDVRAVVARGMNPQNAPAWVWFTGESQEVPSELPKTASGKVQKHVLRDNSRVLSQQGFGRVRVETV